MISNPKTIRESRILALLAVHASLTAADLQARYAETYNAEIPTGSLYTTLARMVARERLQRTGTGRSTEYQRA